MDLKCTWIDERTCFSKTSWTPGMDEGSEEDMGEEGKPLRNVARSSTHLPSEPDLEVVPALCLSP